MINRIEIDKGIFVYRIKHTPINSKESVLKKIAQNETYGTVKNLREDGSYNVGIQSPIVFNCKELNEIIDFANSSIGEIYNQDSFINNTWSFILRPDYKFPTTDENEYGWHEHPRVISNINKKYYDSNVTFVYYLQMPNNLKDDEGKLAFKVNDKIIKILPEENEFIIFSSDVTHRAELSPNSTIDRVVIAGNVHFAKTIELKNKTSLI